MTRIAALVLLICTAEFGAVEAQSVSSTGAKPWITHLLIADVWPCGYSEVWLAEYPVSPRVVSNVDFSVFGPAFTLETADAIHDFVVLGIVFTSYDVAVEQQTGGLDWRGMPKYWPSQLPPPGGRAGYVLLTNYTAVQASTNALNIFDDINGFYEANRAALQAQARQRAVDQQKIQAQMAAQRASAKPLIGPPAFFKAIYYSSSPTSPQ